MSKKIATSPERKAALEAIRVEFKGTDCATQRKRLHETFNRCVSVSTYEAQRFLDVYDPAARVCEMRKQGERITTHMRWIETEAGEAHLVGFYIRDIGAGHEAAH